MDNQIICSQCTQEYCDENLPRLLVNCGHTFCQSCILRMIVQQDDSYFIYCPEDGQSRELQKKCLKSFPKNLALMKVIQAKKNNLSFKDSLIDVSKITKNEEFQEDEDAKDLMAVINGEKSEEQPLQLPKNLHKMSSFQKEQKQSQQELCSAHRKPLDVVCIIDMEKVCANCAIFGKHKGHEFKSLQEIEEDRLNYYSSILKIMQKKEEISNRISNEETETEIMGILANKKGKMKKEIQQKYKKFIQTVEKRKAQTIKSLEGIFLQTQTKLKSQLKIKDTTMKKYSEWEQKSYEKIKILEGDDFQAKLYLLFTEQEEAGEILDEGDLILKDMNKQEENLIQEVESTLENIGLQSDETIYEHIPKFVEVIDEAKKKTIAMSKSKPETIPKPKPKPQRISRVKEVKPKEKEKEKQSVESGKHPSTMESQILTFDEESLLEEMGVEQEEKSLKIEEVVKEKETPKKESSQESTKLIQLNSSCEQFTDRRILERKSFDFADHQKRQAFMNEKIERNKKKLSKIKVPEKYEKMFQALVNDTVETLDFTNAEMGDSTTVLLSELVKGTKVRTLKFIRNKLSDEGVGKMIPYLSNIITLNLSQNFLTDQVLDILGQAKAQLPKLKNIILSQNKIIERKHKAKLEKLRKLDWTVSV